MVLEVGAAVHPDQLRCIRDVLFSAIYHPGQPAVDFTRAIAFDHSIQVGELV
jgi:hypothetical protein